MNLVLLLGQLGLSWDFQRERLFPIGTLYDPFVMRALEGIVYSTYSGSRFVLAGHAVGISLSREGGAHQSIITPGIGIETPGLTYAEPCFARELEWLLLDALARMQTARRRGALPPALDDTDRPGAVRALPSSASARSGCAPTSSPAASASASRGAAEDRVVARRLRRDRARGARGRRAARRRGRRRGDRALPLLARPALPRLAAQPQPPHSEAARRRVAPRAAARARTSAGCPSSP